MDPPLRVREDWWVFEKTLKVKGVLVVFRMSRKDWWVFECQGRTGGFSNVKEALVGFRKTSLALREVFRKPFQSIFSKK